MEIHAWQFLLAQIVLRVMPLSQNQGIMIRRVWDLVLKDPDTMHVLQRNQQLALLSIIQVIHACNIQLVLPVTIVIGISKEDQGIMDLAHRIVDRDRMVTITDLQVDRIILQDTVDRIIRL